MNFLLNITLIGPLAHVGMALATTLAGWLNVALMARNLRRRGLFVWDRLLLARLPRLVLACALMAGLLAVLHRALLPWLDGGLAQKTVALGLLITAGGMLYGAAVLGLRAIAVEDMRRLRRKN